MRQVSAWGQFWWDLAALHKVHGCGITTPLQTGNKPVHRGRYFSTWYRSTPLGPVYYPVDGDTMIGMMRNGLVQTGCSNVRMKTALLNVAVEMVTVEMEKRA